MNQNKVSIRRVGWLSTFGKKMPVKHLVVAVVMCLGAWVVRAAAPFAISETGVPAIVVADGFRPFVTKAAEDLAGDMEKVFGTRPTVRTGSATVASAAIVVVRGGSGWENYALETLPNNVLRITGSDDRGAMFGLYRFASDFLGVDPFYRWSGNEPERAVRREWKGGISLKQGDPSFRFRGWFVNDEDFLNGFRPKENGTRKIAYPRYQVCFGPTLADWIYEAAVRAGFNLMVCASYVDILNPDEKRLVDIASSRGLYVTMHHQEPVGAGALQLDLHFPEMKDTTYASHPDLWRKAWKAYVAEWAKVPDVIWQLGLRGRRDRPFWASLKPNGGGWEDWGVESEAEDRRRAKLISEAMNDQIAMIRAATGDRPFRTATQLWMEGADFYRRGLLEIPKGTTVMFSDNSPGLKFQPDLGGVERLPADRPYGLYYHLAVVCGNHYCELVPPSRTRQVLGFAHAKGARELVLVNVSNVRPFLYTISAAGAMTRDLDSFNAQAYQRDWCARQFGAEAAGKVSRAFDLYFAAYETEFSRDRVSAYGSPRERAPLAILNDGDLQQRLMSLLRRVTHPSRPQPVCSPYAADPDELREVVSSRHYGINQDMFPNLADELRYASRARAQAASFRRGLDQLEVAERQVPEKFRQRLFERIGYPAAFMCAASDCCSELALAAAAQEEGNAAAARRHLEAALRHARERDALDRRYNVGQWTHWYDRNIIYPYSKVTPGIEAVLRLL